MDKRTLSEPSSQPVAMPVQVYLTQAEIMEQGLPLAQGRFERWRDRQEFHYPNFPMTHLRGALGELAVEKWLTESRVDFIPYFRQPEVEGHKPDFILHLPQSLFVGVEVKTWAERYWLDMGRCITPKQLFTLSETKSVDIILWVIMHEPEPFQSYTSQTPWSAIRTAFRTVGRVYFTLAGWNWLVEVDKWKLRETGPESGKILNYQADLKDLHSIEILERLLRRWPGSLIRGS